MNQNQTGSGRRAVDVAVVSLAAVIAVAGLLAFTFLSEQSLGIRLGMLGGSLVVAALMAAFTAPGRQFMTFCRASWEELRRVVWPTRKETVNTTGLVMAFVVAVAFYLFIVDKLVEWGLYDGLLRMTF